MKIWILLFSFSFMLYLWCSFDCWLLNYIADLCSSLLSAHIEKVNYIPCKPSLSKCYYMIIYWQISFSKTKQEVFCHPSPIYHFVGAQHIIVVFDYMSSSPTRGPRSLFNFWYRLGSMYKQYLSYKYSRINLFCISWEVF